MLSECQTHDCQSTYSTATCQVVVTLTRASYCSYKDVLKRNLKAYDIPANSLESLAQDRYLWRTTSRGAAAASEASRTDHLRQVRDRCKARAVQQRVDGLSVQILRTPVWFKNCAVRPREQSPEDGLTLTTSGGVDGSLHRPC